MLFDNKSIAFGRNETFLLRYNWIFKGLSSIKKNSKIFQSPDALNELGVGKNMMHSMRYWLSAYQLVDNQNNAFSNFSKYVLDPEEGVDPYMENQSTLWLLHWKLCTNPTQATLYYWFFNHFAKTSFTKLELANALTDWLNFNSTKKIASKTIERDINLLLKTYSSLNSAEKEFEEQLENPFHELNLLNKNIDGSYNTNIIARDSLNPNVIGYCVADIQNYFKTQEGEEKQNLSTKPVNEILNSSEFPSLQKIFKASQDFLYESLEKLEINYPKLFKVDDTAGQKTLSIMKDLDPMFFLKNCYKRKS